MTIQWRPCAEGDLLYRAAAAEALAKPDVLFTLTDRPAWFAWREHADNCELCRIERE